MRLINQHLSFITFLFAVVSIVYFADFVYGGPIYINGHTLTSSDKFSNDGQSNEETGTEVIQGDKPKEAIDSWSMSITSGANVISGQDELGVEELDHSIIEKYEEGDSTQSLPHSSEQMAGTGENMDESTEDGKSVEINVEDHSVTVEDDMHDNEALDVEGDEDSEEDEDSVDGVDMPNAMHKKTMILGKNERKVKVVVASKTTVEVWKNFTLVGSVKDWRRAVKFLFKAHIGDSITLVSKGFGKHFGIAAIIYTGGKRCYVTGGHGRHVFKAIGMNTLKRLNKPNLRTPRRGMCYLRHPYTVKHQRGRQTRFATQGKALYMLRHKAKYVWARGASHKDVVTLRFVVGGDRCNKPKPSKKPSPTPRQKPIRGGARCPCRVVPARTRSECFEFRNKRFSGMANKVGTCYRRVCERKYECIEPRRSSRIMCVRRFARYEVRSVGPMFKGKCKNVVLRPARPFYAPYS